MPAAIERRKRRIDGAPAGRADLALDHDATLGKYEIRTTAATFVPLRLVLIPSGGPPTSSCRSPRRDRGEPLRCYGNDGQVEIRVAVPRSKLHVNGLPTRHLATFTAAKCRAIAKQRLAQTAHDDDRHRRRLINAAEAWFLLAHRLSGENIAFSIQSVLEKTRSKKRARGNAASAS
jgi:hypothetical protein